MKKKNVIVLGIIMLIFILITIIVLFLNGKENTEAPNNNSNIPIYSTAKKIDNYVEFFSIQSTLNDISNAGINTSYIVKEIYLNSVSNTKYYFINSCKLGGSTQYEKNVYFVLILNTINNTYYLNRVTGITNLELYANNYDIKKSDFDSDNQLKSIKINTENVLTSYIEYFKNMLIVDSNVAYELLDEDTKKQYNGLDDFKSSSQELYNKLSSKIFSYKNSEEETIVYHLEDDNRNKIKIYENSVMNFKIAY